MTFSTRSRLALPLLPFALASRASAQDGTGGPMAPTMEPGESWPTAAWPTSPPETHGLPADLAAQIDAMAVETTPLLTSLLVVRGGDLVAERYYNGFTADQAFHIWSVTKSITTISTGIAFAEGLLDSLDQTIGELIPERIPKEVDLRVPGITLYQLLTSTSGWAWDGRINFSRHDETDNLELMLARPLACDPGDCYEYDSTNSNLLSYITQKVSGVTMAEYLQPRLFDPLGIAPPEWIAMDQGETRGAGGLFLRPADLAKIGLLYLRQGQWAGKQLVPAEWVAESTRAHASGTSSVSGVNIGGGGEYGYQWWIKAPYGIPAYYGNGYGGQTLYVVPDLDLVVVTGVAGTDVDRPDLQQRVLPIIEDVIIPLAT
jgi:CubicO group peptidase (beta-lactamase class C family)